MPKRHVVGKPGSDPHALRPASRRSAGLRISESTVGASHVLELQGELDLASVPALYTAVDSLAPEAHEIVLDMGGLTFMDSTGLYVLLRLRGVCRDHHSRLVLCSVSPRIQRLLEITGLLAPMREQGFVRE